MRPEGCGQQRDALGSRDKNQEGSGQRVSARTRFEMRVRAADAAIESPA